MNVNFENLFTGSVEFSINDPKETITLLPTCKGVIFFTDKNNTPIQLIACANIRSMVRAKLLQNEQDDIKTKKTKLGTIVKKIYFLCCYNEFRTHLNLYKLAKSIFRDNFRDAIELPKLNLVKIDLTQKWPNFTVTQNSLKNDNRLNFGPFPSRKAAANLVNTLKETFSLCRRPELIDSPVKAKSCPYLQMNSCPAPCVGNIEYAEYLNNIAIAVKVASGDIAKGLTFLKSQMENASKKLDFEKAEVFKKKIETLKKLNSQDFKWTTKLSQFQLLHIDKSAKLKRENQKVKQQSYYACFLKAGQLFELKDFFIDELPQRLEEIDKINDSKLSFDKNSTEIFALISYFIYRTTPSGIWLKVGKAIPKGVEITQIVDNYFTKK